MNLWWGLVSNLPDGEERHVHVEGLGALDQGK